MVIAIGISFIHYSTHCNVYFTDSESEELVNQIVKKLENHQLTHLVIDDANIHQTFFERLLLTFKDHYRLIIIFQFTVKPV
jgi:hypothetical protein